jgi:hypothetical protein
MGGVRKWSLVEVHKNFDQEDVFFRDVVMFPSHPFFSEGNVWNKNLRLNFFTTENCVS